jgi:hypothetical protein
VSRRNPNGTAKEVAPYIIKHRPELRQEVIDCMAEMGCELRVPSQPADKAGAPA